MVLWSVEQVLMFRGGCNYLGCRTKYEVEIQSVNLPDTYKHYIGILPCFSDYRSIMSRFCNLEDGNVHRLLLKNKTATMVFSKNLFLFF